MMNILSWITGIGIPSLVGFACLAGAVYAWFQIPVFGHWIGLGAAVLGVGLLAHASGYSSARADCQDASLRTELAQVRADLEKEKNARAADRKLGELLNQAEARNMELAHELATRPEPDACRNATDGDAQRLRDIR
jgi:hypothetical protein